MTIIAASIPVLRPFLRDAISSAGRYMSADASDARTDPYGRSRSKSLGTTSMNPPTNTSVRMPSRSYSQSQGTRQAGPGDLESGHDRGASDISAELRGIINSDARGVVFNPTPSLDVELQDMSKKGRGDKRLRV